MEAALRTAKEWITVESGEAVEFGEVRGTEGIKEASYKIGDLELNVCVASGLKNAKKVLESVKSGEKNYHFIEIMGCPGGCVNGGGQPVQPAAVRNFIDLKARRAAASVSYTHLGAAHDKTQQVAAEYPARLTIQSTRSGQHRKTAFLRYLADGNFLHFDFPPAIVQGQVNPGHLLYRYQGSFPPAPQSSWRGISFYLSAGIRRRPAYYSREPRLPQAPYNWARRRQRNPTR